MTYRHALSLGRRNSLHWVLDVIFREDEARVRVGHAAHNMAILRQWDLNILKKADLKESIRRRRKIAALNTTYLEKILAYVFCNRPRTLVRLFAPQSAISHNTVNI